MVLHPISLLMTPFSAVTILILLTDRQQSLPSPQTLTKSQWSNTVLLMYPYCPPFTFSLAPHRYLHPLFVRLRLLSPSTLLLVLPLSPAPFVMCVLIWSVIALPQASTLRLSAGDGQDTKTHISGRFPFTDDFSRVSETTLLPPK